VGLPEKNFDLVVAQTYLHHILFLEGVAEPSGSTMAGESIRGDEVPPHSPRLASGLAMLLQEDPEKRPRIRIVLVSERRAARQS
jgi:hypothetical protein